ncbi:alpha-hydroxy acid oxidase [Fodinicola feengrottensis]
MRWTDGLADLAATRLSPSVYQYFRRGASGERTAAEAVDAWDQLRLRPHMLRNVSAVSTATTVLGTEIRTPILVSPSTLQVMCDPCGEAATATGVGAAGSLMCVTSNTGVPFAKVGETGTPWWVQAYLLRDRGLCRDMLVRAREAGARAVVLTADVPVVGTPPPTEIPDVWGVVPAGSTMANWGSHSPDRADDLSLDDLGWLREVSGLPVVLKGVLRGDDARDAVSAGASAIMVSNHGGRQLDGAVSTAYALPEVANAVSGTDAEVYVDGGIRRGEHVLSALALGARAVFVGRPVLYALAVDGAAGVQRLLTDLTAELAHALALAGSASPADVPGDLVVRPPV